VLGFERPTVALSAEHWPVVLGAERWLAAPAVLGAGPLLAESLAERLAVASEV